MGMQTDVKSLFINFNGSLYADRTRLKGIILMPGGTAGNFQLRDGGVAGPILFKVALTTSTVPIFLSFPGEGILFATNIYADTLPTSTTATLFYG